MRLSVVFLVLALPLCIVRANAQPSSASTIPDLTPEQWHEDLTYMIEHMEAVHCNLFHTMTNEAFTAAVQEVHDRISNLQDHEVIVELARIVAMVSDGHTQLWLGPGSTAGFKQYPIRLYLFEEGLFVPAITEEYAYASGARVLKIGNLSAEEAYERAQVLSGRDNQMQLHGNVPRLLIIPEVLHALGITDDRTHGTYVVAARDGEQHLLTLTPQPADPALALWAVEPSPELFEHGFVGTRDRDPEATPLYLRETRPRNSVTYLPEASTVYVQVNAIANAEEESFAEFAARVYRLVDEHWPGRIVIDLRHNGGGNNTLYAPLVHGLIERPWLNQSERAFVIIGRHTFSAASHLVTFFETHTRATFVGEPTGASPYHYGDPFSITLPNSGLQVLASAVYWQNAAPWDQRPWTAPDVSVPVTFADYATNRDPAMVAIMNYEEQPSLIQQIVDAIEQGASADDIKQVYDDVANRPRNEYAIFTDALNLLGYHYLGQGNTDVALAIFQLNVTAYANGYDSLGEALAMVGRIDEAIAAYEHALALHPDSRTRASSRAQLMRLKRLEQ